MKYFHLKQNVFLYIYISETMTRLRIIDLNIKARSKSNPVSGQDRLFNTELPCYSGHYANSKILAFGPLERS